MDKADRARVAAAYPDTLSRRTFVATALGAAVAAGALGPRRPAGAQQPVRGGELRFGLRTEPDNLDPAVTPWAVSHRVMMHVYDTLVWQDPTDLGFKPGLAESWQVAPDGLSYTFKLRRGVKFHDGTAFNAAAVKFSFDRIADPETKSGFAAALLGPYAGADVVDEQTVRVRFKVASAGFLDGASQAFLGIVSPAAVKQQGKDFGLRPVGTGPFVFKEWERQDHITLERNPDYQWASPVFKHQGPAYLDRVVFKIIPEDATRLATLENNETNFIETVPEQDLARLRADSRFKLIIGSIPGLPIGVFLNTQKEPTDSLEVRQAILQGLSRADIIKTVYFGAYQPAHGPLSSNTLAYNKKVESLNPFDRARARELLERAGWKAGAGGIRQKDGKPLKLEFVSSEFFKGLVTVVQAQLRELGMQVEPKLLANPTRLATASKGEMNLANLGWVASNPAVLGHFFHSKNIGAYNWPRVKDARVDEMLDRAEASVDVERRKQLYGEVQEFAMQQALFFPVYEQLNFCAARAEVHDIRPDARGSYLWLYDTFVTK
jgi:peptide/nickel transport system substrate-binding protein